MAKMVENSEKRDVRLQIFITQAMDDKLDNIAELMGMSKNELVRMAIGNLTLGYNKSIDILKETVTAEMNKEKE